MLTRTSVFVVGNTSRRGAFILARDAEDAAAIAKQLGHVKTQTNARVHSVDFSDDTAFDSLQSLQMQGKRGRIGKKVSMRTDKVGAITRGAWVMLNEVQHDPI